MNKIFACLFIVVCIEQPLCAFFGRFSQPSRIFGPAYTAELPKNAIEANNLKKEYNYARNKYAKDLKKFKGDFTEAERLTLLFNDRKANLQSLEDYREIGLTLKEQKLLQTLRTEVFEIGNLKKTAETLEQAKEKGLLAEKPFGAPSEPVITKKTDPEKKIEQVKKKTEAPRTEQPETTKLSFESASLSPNIGQEVSAAHQEIVNIFESFPKKKVQGVIEKIDWQKTNIYEELQSDINNLKNETSQYSKLKTKLADLDNKLLESKGKIENYDELLDLRRQYYARLQDMLHTLREMKRNNKKEFEAINEENSAINLKSLEDTRLLRQYKKKK